MFRRDKDFEAFERILEEAVARSEDEIRLFAYCAMGNHWHLVLQTTVDGAMGRFVKWLATTHAGRYRVAHASVGLGHLYQGRFKSFLVETEPYLLTVCRYVERNPVRAGLVQRAEDWRWSSLWRWRLGSAEAKALLSNWPLPGRTGRPRNWLRTVNTPLSVKELSTVRSAANRHTPFGSSAWRDAIVERFDLQSTMRRPGRPRKASG